MVGLGYDQMDVTRAARIDGSMSLVTSHPLARLAHDAIDGMIRACANPATEPGLFKCSVRPHRRLSRTEPLPDTHPHHSRRARCLQLRGLSDRVAIKRRARGSRRDKVRERLGAAVASDQKQVKGLPLAFWSILGEPYGMQGTARPTASGRSASRRRTSAIW